MNVCLLNSHSRNNRDIFELSERNHRYYCETHNYDMLNVIKPYDRCLDLDLIKLLLLTYDIVAVIDSDILFTDYSKKITDFAIGDITCATEPSYNNTIKGGFTIFKRSAYYILPTLQATQNKCGDYKTALATLRNAITILPIQHAAPSLNTTVADSCWHPGDFAIHFHTIGRIPINSVKASAMREFLTEHPELDNQ